MPALPRRLLLLILLSGALAASAAGGADRPRPNLVLIIADDLNPDDTGAYGHPHARTPSLDRLAREGLRCDRAFATTSSCSPSRASILTGRYPHATGAAELHMPLPATQLAFTEQLREAGYYTAAAGKWHLGPAAKPKFDLVREGGGPSGCEQWLPVLRERPKDRPFFLWLAAIDPHRPYADPAVDKVHTQADTVVPPFLPDRPEVRRDLAEYQDEITRMDRYVGQVLEELERQQVARDTLVLFISDNGRPFPRSKTTLYDSGIRTPFVVRYPARVKPASVSPRLVSTVDIAPTFLELAGAKPLPRAQGRSFTRLLDDSQAVVREHVFAEHNWHDYRAYERAVRTEKALYLRNWLPHLRGNPPADAVRSPTFQLMRRLRDEGKLTTAQQSCFVTPRREEELYDVERDPHQLHNLAAAASPALLGELRKVLDDWRERTGDRFDAERLTPDRLNRETGEPLPKE